MSVVSVPNLEPGTVVGEFTIIGKLAEGGMGIVYSAEHPKIGKKAAVKVISPELCTNAEAVGRFAAEARAVNAIGHPNIVDIFSFGELDDGRNYFVMEWLQGRSLAELVEAGPIDLDFALYIIDQIADAVDAAHEKDIVHRDLKPDNVFVVDVRGGRHSVKLLDFGIAKLTDNGQDSVRTRTGLVMGTPGYISPEQARGRDVGFPADVYSLGAMAFELITGRLPFVADNAMDIVAKHLAEPPPRCSDLCTDLPQALDDLIYETLCKNASARPSLSEIRVVIDEVRSSIAKGDTPAHSYARPQSSSRPIGNTAIAATEISKDPSSRALSRTPIAATEIVAPVAALAQRLETNTSKLDRRNQSKRPWIVLSLLAAAALTGGALFMLRDTGEDTSKPNTAKQSGSSTDKSLVAPPAAPSALEKDTAVVETPVPKDTPAIVEDPALSDKVDVAPEPSTVTITKDPAVKNEGRPTRKPPKKRIRPVKNTKKTPLVKKTPTTPKNPIKKPVKKKDRNGDYTIDPFAR